MPVSIGFLLYYDLIENEQISHDMIIVTCVQEMVRPLTAGRSVKFFNAEVSGCSQIKVENLVKQLLLPSFQSASQKVSGKPN